jgi:hypothetical protein
VVADFLKIGTVCTKIDIVPAKISILQPKFDEKIEFDFLQSVKFLSTGWERAQISILLIKKSVW